MNKNRLLIVTHGNLGSAMIEVARKIIGESSENDVFFLSNDGLSTKETAERIKDVTKNYTDDHFLIITDFPGGSCFIASKKIASSDGKISALSGLNISMLLSFLTKKDILTGPRLAEVVKIDGGRAIVS
ncbi:MAG: PTS sugar transporter subunit IIA [Candidatus Delongbacteria bacterium]